MPPFLRWHRKRKPGVEVVFIIIVIFISLFVFILRSQHLDQLSLWMDEGFYVLACQQILAHGYPLYPSGHILFKGIIYSYVLSLVGWLFGPTTFTLRMVSVVASILVLILFYFLARKLVSPAIALAGVIILAFSSWETEYARTAIYFSPLQLVYLACLYFFIVTFLEGKKKYLWLTTGLFLLAPHVHQLAMGTLFSFVALFLISGARRFFRRDVILPLVIISISYLLLQLHELFFWKVGYVYEKEPTSLMEGVSYFFQGFTLAYFREILHSFPRMGLVVFASLFLFFGLRLSQKASEGAAKVFLDRWLFFNLNFFLPLVFFGFFRTHIQPRYLFQLHPLLVLLFLVAARELSRALFEIFLSPVLSSFRHNLLRHNLLARSLTAGLFLTMLVIFSDQVGWKTTQRIINRDYRDRINTDVITRSGRTEHYDYQGPGLYTRYYRQPGDIIVSMHMVFQYIYGGQVDYWLWTGGPGTWDAWEKTPEGWKDVYVGARWLNSLEDLKRLIASRGERRLWLVTTPSIYRRDHINQEVAEFILSQKSRLVFRGRDGMSEVYLWEKEGEELAPSRPTWEAEWLPASVGEIRLDSHASRGSYLRFSRQTGRIQKSLLWAPDLPAGEYRILMKMRTTDEGKKLKDSRFELTLRTKKGRLVVFSRVVRSRELSPEGEWMEITGEVILPGKEDLWLTVSYEGEKPIDWDYLDFQLLKKNGEKKNLNGS